VIAPSLTPAQVLEIANRLARAALERTPIEPLTETYPNLKPADAYAIQQEVAAARFKRGEALVGWKLGLTSRAMQEQLQVREPDYGPLLSGDLVPDGSELTIEDLIAPRVEAEIAFFLDKPLRGPGVGREDVLAATSAVAAAIEVIDSRIAGWRIKLADTIADMASCARVVVGASRTRPEGLDLRALSVVLFKNGDPVASGTGAAVLGDPFEAVAWAANTLGVLGVTLLPGQLLMPGAMHASQTVSSGDVIEARFSDLGSVSVRFVGNES
jgi:2-oxopent-4-enoate hydratase